jgi:hypothetical protein
VFKIILVFFNISTTQQNLTQNDHGCGSRRLLRLPRWSLPGPSVGIVAVTTVLRTYSCLDVALHVTLHVTLRLHVTLHGYVTLPGYITVQCSPSWRARDNFTLIL